MRCPECGSEIEEGSTICKFCHPEDGEYEEDDIKVMSEVGEVYTMEDWLKDKELEKEVERTAERKELERKLAEKKRQMELQQAEVDLDKMLENIQNKRQSRRERTSYEREAELADNLSRLSEEDFNELVRELARDKKKEVRARLSKE